LTSLDATGELADPRREVAVLVFPPFELDVVDERLWKAGEELQLRRKPFAILRYLAEHPRRLVTQQELVDAVWGEVAMSDSVLRTHIRDLRRVLGEDLIETVVGRGYRFLVEVTGGTPPPARDTGIPAPAIAGRQDKLEILANAMREALAHRRQTVFLAGDAASIAGAVFTSAVVAGALGTPPADVEAACELLADEHPYLRRLEVEPWPDGSLHARYGFTHAIYQHAAAARVSSSAERHWQGRIAACLEAGHRAAPAAIAAELAMHFDRAQLPAKASAYYVMAGKRSMQRSGGADALRNFERARDLVAYLPEGAERDTAELHVLRHLAPALFMTRALTTPELIATYQRTSELASRLGDDLDLARALVGMLLSRLLRGDFRELEASATPVIEVVQRAGDPALVAHVELAMSSVAMVRGRLDEANDRLGAARAALEARAHRPAPGQAGYLADRYASAWSFSAFLIWLRGFPDAAIAHARAELATAESTEEPFLIAALLSIVSTIHMWRGEAAAALEAATRGLTIAKKFDFKVWGHRAEIVILWASARSGELSASLGELETSLSDLRAASRVGTAMYALPYIEVCAWTGQRAKALEETERGLAIANEIDERAAEPELLRMRGEIVKSDDAAEARRWFAAALELSRSQRSRSFELRAAMSLARLGESRADLRRIYDTFTEGFDTSDLVEARALLA
jgi:DNA-binding winged helix-turn-helix (wHTH) protein